MEFGPNAGALVSLVAGGLAARAANIVLRPRVLRTAEDGMVERGGSNVVPIVMRRSHCVCRGALSVTQTFDDRVARESVIRASHAIGVGSDIRFGFD